MGFADIVNQGASLAEEAGWTPQPADVLTGAVERLPTQQELVDAELLRRTRMAAEALLAEGRKYYDGDDQCVMEMINDFGLPNWSN